MVQLCIMKLASNAEAPSILGKVKQKIIDIGAVTHVFLLFGTYLCDGQWVALPSSWCPESVVGLRKWGGAWRQLVRGPIHL